MGLAEIQVRAIHLIIYTHFISLSLSLSKIHIVFARLLCDSDSVIMQ